MSNLPAAVIYMSSISVFVVTLGFEIVESSVNCSAMRKSTAKINPKSWYNTHACIYCDVPGSPCLSKKANQMCGSFPFKILYR